MRVLPLSVVTGSLRYTGVWILGSQGSACRSYCCMDLSEDKYQHTREDDAEVKAFQLSGSQ
jgi:hypothetical protein